MKFRCVCDEVIRDQHDFLPYKAHYINDQDYDHVEDLISASILDLMKAIDEGHEEKWIADYYGEHLDHPSRKEVIEDISSNIREQFEKNMYQCKECGRLYLEEQGSQKLLAFTPDGHNNKEVLKSEDL